MKLFPSLFGSTAGRCYAPDVVIVGGEAPAEEPAAEAPAAEAVSEAAVEIARIEAERDIVLAEIHAETIQTETTAWTDADRLAMQAELEQCRTLITAQSIEIAELKATISLTLQASEPPVPPNPPPASESADPTPEPLEEVSAAVVPEPPKKRRPTRWI